MCSSCGPSSTCCAPGGQRCASPRATSPRRVQLCERFGLEHEVIGRHRGGRVAAKAVGLAQRSGALVRWARRNGPFDLALGHGSNDVTVAARAAAHPVARRCSTTSGRRCSTTSTAGSRRRSWCPTRSRPSASSDTARAASCTRYPGLKEEYYLADFEPDPAVLDELGLDRSQPLAVVRTPPVVSLYHRFENDVFADVLDAPARHADRRAAPHPRAARPARRLHRARARRRRASRSSPTPISSSAPAAR